VISTLVDTGLSGGNRLAFSNKRQGTYPPVTTRDEHVDWPRRMNQ
jgi:hypothetical protein